MYDLLNIRQVHNEYQHQIFGWQIVEKSIFEPIKRPTMKCQMVHFTINFKVQMHSTIWGAADWQIP